MPLKKLNRVQLAPMVTFSCWLMKTEKCNQTLAFVNAAEIGIRQTHGPWCASSYHTQTINSISYNFHLKETQRWADHLRLLGAQPLEGKVFCFGAGWVSSPSICVRGSQDEFWGKRRLEAHIGPHLPLDCPALGQRSTWEGTESEGV